MASKKRYVAVHLTDDQWDALNELTETAPYNGFSRAELLRRGLELMLFDANIPIPQRIPRRGTYKRD